MKKIFIIAAIAFFVSACNYSQQTDSFEEQPSVLIIGGISSGELTLDVEYTINKPVSEGGLQVFKITGEDKLKDKKYTSLSTALENKMVKVNETGSVNQLSIENNSDEYVFIHSGDIVKGGQQDRAIANDVIIPPKSKDVPLQSFCVEQGRWSQREGEDVKEFGSNTKMLSSKKLKLAAKYDKNQQKVWRNVADQQEELKENVSKINGYEADVKSEVSASSLQLSLESEELKKAKAGIENKFQDILENDTNVIGYAYAINGEILGVDIYNNKKLFKELWPKIKESILTEAIAKYKEDSTSLASVEDVDIFIKGINVSVPKIDKQEVNKQTKLETTENATGNVLFSTIDAEEDQWIHINFMKKEKEEEKVQKSNRLRE